MRSASEICLVFVQLYVNITTLIGLIREELASVIPKVRPIDIQSTDAGPGVGTSEKMVKIRMTETFILGDLDLIARFHYAPMDSKCHVVDRVMSRLNDAPGDGNPISLNYPEESMEATNISEEHKEAMKEQAARTCAEHVS